MRQVHSDQGNTAVNYTHAHENPTNNGPALHGLSLISKAPTNIVLDLVDPEPCPGDVMDTRQWTRQSDEQLYVNGVSYNDIEQG
jgi:hypothetical protein